MSFYFECCAALYDQQLLNEWLSFSLIQQTDPNKVDITLQLFSVLVGFCLVSSECKLRSEQTDQYWIVFRVGSGSSSNSSGSNCSSSNVFAKCLQLSV